VPQSRRSLRPGKSRNRGLSQVRSATRMLQYDASEQTTMWPNSSSNFITEPFSLSNSAPAFWWDFSDAGYVADSEGEVPTGGNSTLTPGGTFSYVYDKSGNGVGGVVSGTVIWDLNTPGMNGRICARTTGAGFIRADTGYALNGGTLFIVYQNDEFQTGASPFASPRNLYHTDHPTTGSSSVGIRMENDSNGTYLYLGNGTAANATSAGITQRGDLGVSVHILRVAGDGTAQVRHNGEWQPVVSVPNLTTTGWNNSFSLFKGFNQDAERNWKGAVGEVIMLDQPLSDKEVDGVESWLMEKWGITKYRNTIATELSAVTTPLDLGLPCSLWLDASDTSSSSMTFVPGTTQAIVWKDKSGNGNNFTPYNTSGPLTTVGPSSIPYAFTGSVIPTKSILLFAGNLGMTCPNNVIGKSNVTVFAVVGERVAQQYAGVISSANNADNTPALRVDNFQMAMQGQTTAAYEGVAYNRLTQVICGIVDAGAPTLFMNSAQKQSPAATGSLGSPTTTSIGSNRIQGASQNFWDGWICELIVYPSVLSATDRKRVEKYLRGKWLPAVSITDQSQKVGAWKEYTTNTYDAKQATTANKPTLVYDATTTKPGLSLDATDELRSEISIGELILTANTSPQTAFFFVASPTSQTDAISFGSPTMANSVSRVFFSSYFGGSVIFDVGSAVEPGGGRLTGALPPYSTAPRVWAAYRNGASLVVRRDGLVALSGAAAGNFTSTSATLSLGKPLAGTSNCTIHEFLAYRGVPTDAEIKLIEKYLSAKWLTRYAPTVGNPDAQDWIRRVYLNGGEVSAATADAVNTFCNTIDGFGNLRPLFFRLNLLCGTGINAMTVPLYRGPTRTGQQYGLSADSNLGSPGFDSPTFYNETGTLGGLQGASGKYLSTGFPTNTLSAGNRHLAAYVRSNPLAAYTEFLGSETSGGVGTNQFLLGYQVDNNRVSFRCGSTSSAGAVSAVQTAGGFWIGSSPTTTTADLFKNGAVEVSGASTSVGTPDSSPVFVMAMNRSSTPAATDYFLGRMCAYSIGLSMNSTQAANYNTAMQAFQVALQRNV